MFAECLLFSLDNKPTTISKQLGAGEVSRLESDTLVENHSCLVVSRVGYTHFPRPRHLFITQSCGCLLSCE